MTEKTEIAQRIKAIRENLGLRQNQFAEALGISKPTVSDLERGKYEPNMKVIRNLALTFNVNLVYLILGVGEMFGAAAHTQMRSLLSDRSIVSEGEFMRFLNDLERSPFLLLSVLSFYRGQMTKEEDVIARDFENYKKSKSEAEEPAEE